MVWSLPTNNILKVNVDASFSERENIAGLGMVIRDNNGHVCLSAVTKVRHVHSILFVEIKAILFGLQIATQYGYDCL
ncbi:hypothetical protein REPUB_Repub15cG0063700 [Reevesia pubescens]